MIDTSRISFLGPGLERLWTATVCVVGVGGGGSHVAQQMAHLGTGVVVPIDPDKLARSNVNRVPCSRYADVGRPKAEIFAERLRGLGGRVVPVVGRAESVTGRAWIERADLVIGAVDGARARKNIERICRGALVPYIDIGLKIDIDDVGRVRAIGGQVFTSLPGGPCMWCAEILTEASLARDREEYTVGLPEQQVISLNGLLASQAVNNALSLLTGYVPDFPVRAVIRYDGLVHEMRPDPYVIGPCPHHPPQEAGWCHVLPPRRGGTS
ncbi:MAG: ThiF family adenylyltransferase [Candidatus Baltobacteraceae bacterium]